MFCFCDGLFEGDSSSANELSKLKPERLTLNAFEQVSHNLATIVLCLTPTSLA